MVDPTKTSLRDGIYPNFEFNIFTEEPQLCVFTTLRLYLEATHSLSGKEDFLFIIFRKPYTRALGNTLSGWIKQTLQAAGIDANAYTAYSTRHAGTSSTARKDATLNTIR